MKVSVIMPVERLGGDAERAIASVLAQQTAHDLAGPGLGKRGGHVHPVQPGDAPDRALHRGGRKAILNFEDALGFRGKVAVASSRIMGPVADNPGKAMLAAAENRAAAGMIGIDAFAMNRIGFALSAAVGALAGILIAPNTYITYDGGTIIGLKGFVAATILGMGSLPGAVVGGLTLGILQAGASAVSSPFASATRSRDPRTARAGRPRGACTSPSTRSPAAAANRLH